MYLFPKFSNINFFRNEVNIVIFSNQSADRALYFNMRSLSDKHDNINYINWRKCNIDHQVLKLYNQSDIKINTNILYFHYSKLMTKHLVSIQNIFDISISSEKLNLLIKNKILLLGHCCLAIIDEEWDTVAINLSNIQYQVIIFYYHDNLHDILNSRINKYCNVGYSIILKNYILHTKK